VLIKTLNGDLFEIEVLPDETVLSFKQKLFELNNEFEVDSQVLSLVTDENVESDSSFLSNDTQNMQSYGLQNGDLLMLMIDNTPQVVELGFCCKLSLTYHTHAL
jgi:hypothetical protein